MKASGLNVLHYIIEVFALSICFLKAYSLTFLHCTMIMTEKQLLLEHHTDRRGFPSLRQAGNPASESCYVLPTLFR